MKHSVSDSIITGPGSKDFSTLIENKVNIEATRKKARKRTNSEMFPCGFLEVEGWPVANKSLSPMNALFSKQKSSA